MSHAAAIWQQDFLHSHQLTDAYITAAQKWFNPLAANLATYSAKLSRPMILAVNGSQGSGKSTLGDYLVAALKCNHQLSAVSLSLDDFYHTRAYRVRVAQTVHPLLATRGVPGTHDIALLNRTLDSLMVVRGPCGQSSVAEVPRFSKSIDDRLPQSSWQAITNPVDVIVLEGWCLGAQPQSETQLKLDINILEQQEDRQGRWRSYVNDKLRDQFLPLYGRVDQWLMLKAPSFDCVFQWRLEQEQKLAHKASLEVPDKVMNEVEVFRFIQHCQRHTQCCLDDLPGWVNYLYELDEHRTIIKFKYRESLPG